MAAGSVPIRSLPKCRPKPGAVVSPERVRPVRAVELDGAEQHVDAALPRTGDEVVEQVQMVVGDQVAGAVGGFPVAPEGQPQAVPAHAGELRHVLVDHLLAIAVDVAGRAVVGGGVNHVVRAEEGDLLPVVAPADHALAVQVDGPIGYGGSRAGRALGMRRGDGGGERRREQDGQCGVLHAWGGLRRGSLRARRRDGPGRGTTHHRQVHARRRRARPHWRSGGGARAGSRPVSPARDR